MIQRQPAKRVIRHAIDFVNHTGRDVRIEGVAYSVFHEAAEAWINKILSAACLIAINSKRTTLMTRDIVLACRIMGGPKTLFRTDFEEILDATADPVEMF